MDEPTFRTESMRPAESEQRIGSYRILHPLGSGGMSSVWRAVHVDTNQEVALKILTPARWRRTRPCCSVSCARPAAPRRSSTKHRGDLRSRSRRGPALPVLEYVTGGDLHDYIQRHGPLSLAEAIAVVKDVAAGLKYAANRGLIHRDVKPSNLLRTPAGQVKIIDLGLALQNEFEDERVTRDGTTVGTVDYMAPDRRATAGRPASRATSTPWDALSITCWPESLRFPAAISPTSSPGTPATPRPRFATCVPTCPPSSARCCGN